MNPPTRFGVVMVEDNPFISTHEDVLHISTDRKGGAVHLALLTASTKEEALKQVPDALDYHGGLNHILSPYRKDEPYKVYRKWDKVFLVENVEELPVEEWAQAAGDEFWAEQAQKEEVAEKAELVRLKRKFEGVCCERDHDHDGDCDRHPADGD